MTHYHLQLQHFPKYSHYPSLLSFPFLSFLFLCFPLFSSNFLSFPLLFFPLLFSSLLFSYLYPIDVLVKYYLPNRMDDLSSVRTVSVTFNNGRSQYTFKQSDVKLNVVQKSMYGKNVHISSVCFNYHVIAFNLQNHNIHYFFSPTEVSMLICMVK